jgi:hypothetical protein
LGKEPSGHVDEQAAGFGYRHIGLLVEGGFLQELHAFVLCAKLRFFIRMGSKKNCFF